MNEKKRPKEEEEKPASAGAEAPDRDLEKLRQELDRVRQEKDELFTRLQRIYADYANFQKRVPKNIADTVAYEREKLIKSFLPVLDNFDRTLREAHSAQTIDAVVTGVEIIYNQMLNILKQHGVEQIQTLNEKFDPERHEAMLGRQEPDKENDIVLEEFQKGYTLDGRVLRPSRVAVNKVQALAPSTEGSEKQPEEQTRPSKEESSASGTDAAEAPSERQSNTE
ncbi:MAG: nucleotide exchange factor GrpE [Planctomycetes bacterium RBG_13_60_9]|nr:MAG: nucleotide exchange factor GrpE [Planctomycetes bacterium RBG_13_60_9]